MVSLKKQVKMLGKDAARASAASKRRASESTPKPIPTPSAAAGDIGTTGNDTHSDGVYLWLSIKNAACIQINI